jgi:hypothetical protein
MITGTTVEVGSAVCPKIACIGVDNPTHRRTSHRADASLCHRRYCGVRSAGLGRPSFLGCESLVSSGKVRIKPTRLRELAIK